MPMTLAGGLVQIAREGGAISRAVMASVRANDVSTGRARAPETKMADITLRWGVERAGGYGCCWWTEERHRDGSGKVWHGRVSGEGGIGAECSQPASQPGREAGMGRIGRTGSSGLEWWYTSHMGYA